MNSEILEQMKDDFELAKNLSEIQSPEDMRILVGKLNSYHDLINQTMAEHEYKLSQLKGKKQVLLEYIRNLKDAAKEASISRSQASKNY